ncbi:hypothetical protein [Gluconobacter roseus]|uniref:Uncharacterized protein n=1 Tax=Gluconobacter roseus NBRC 3990 TaxID=1307950 RepID=A0A4Y3M3N3_9PROT|nr:hypothetical protein [Gluconobacter roseus]KXV43092.1 hypothetical protein AD943_08895 [Gluconobacter roseus]GBR43262.1 hypothetical protein AA3990_0366 [Gluconobacter roseus NBRC 3990]GEB03900.1 hypothetical protein GRO01_14760 [Gluconobacter roseus NBRC 3990]GLP94353.1 hypothetical protein GCM10007871_23310 [Gluconobacter roseus NBRC 3990]
MTQTGQSSAVRTRDKMVMRLKSIINDPCDHHRGVLAQKYVDQAMALGAEEQRRKEADLSRAQLFCRDQKDASNRTPERADVVQWQKDQNEFFLSNVLEIVTEYAAWRDRGDAEGQEPVAWIDASELPERENNMACSTASLSPLKSHYETTALYIRPANVAALEARVKVLEEENEKFRNALFYIDETAKGFWDPKGHKDCIEIARAALTREGGE